MSNDLKLIGRKSIHDQDCLLPQVINQHELNHIEEENGSVIDETSE